MASTGFEYNKGPQDDPPSYNSIEPYAPPTTTPPTVPIPPMASLQMKGVPPGLEHFIPLNQLNGRERFSATQHHFGRNFEVLDSAGRSLFQASQDYQFCCPTYHVKITDNSQREVLTLQQQRACCISREIEVISLGGIFLGRIKLHLNAFVTHLSVISPENIVLLHVIGPGFQTNVFGNSSFEVKSPDEQHVVGMFRYENSQFILSFPLDLDVGVKALLLGGCMFLDTLLYGARARMMRQRRCN